MKEKRKYADRKAYIKNAVAKRRKKIRQQALDMMGGQCNICLYNRCLKALEFHHINSSEKSFGISEYGLTRAWTKIEAELKKCILLCANCHREVHAGITQLPVATSVET